MLMLPTGGGASSICQRNIRFLFSARERKYNLLFSHGNGALCRYKLRSRCGTTDDWAGQLSENPQFIVIIFTLSPMCFWLRNYIWEMFRAVKNNIAYICWIDIGYQTQFHQLYFLVLFAASNTADCKACLLWQRCKQIHFHSLNSIPATNAVQLRISKVKSLIAGPGGAILELNRIILASFVVLNLIKYDSIFFFFFF